MRVRIEKNVSRKSFEKRNVLISRDARGGSEGLSISFLCENVFHRKLGPAPDDVVWVDMPFWIPFPAVLSPLCCAVVQSNVLVMQAVKDALEEVKSLRGWRAFFMMAPEAADANGIVETLPWAAGGVARPGTAVRLIAAGGGKLIVITGGALSDDEGRLLFEFRDKLRDALLSAYVLPSRSAASELITLMYESGSAPGVPTTELPNVRIFDITAVAALCIFYVIKWGKDEQLLPLLIISFVIFLMSSLIAWRKRKQLATIMNDPEYLVASSWSADLPQRT